LGECPKIAGKIYVLVPGERKKMWANELWPYVALIRGIRGGGGWSEWWARGAVGVAAVVSLAKVATKLKLWTGKNF